MDRVALYGTGKTASFLYKNMVNVKVCHVVDGDSSKVGGSFFEFRIKPTDEIDIIMQDVDKVIICSNFYSEILDDLKPYCVDLNKIVIASYEKCCFDSIEALHASALYPYLNDYARKVFIDSIEEKHIKRIIDDIADKTTLKEYSNDEYPLSVYQDAFSFYDKIEAMCLEAILRKPNIEISMCNCFGYKNYVDAGYEARFITKYNYPSDCYPIICFLKKYINKVETSFDVGANRGMMSLYFSMISDEVHSFEPSHEVSTYAKRNIALNGFNNIKWNECGVADNNTTLKYYDYGMECSGHNSFILQNKDELMCEKEVKVVSLDQYCKENGVNSIDILKIDVEGFEPKVIKGANKLLKQGLVKMIIFEVSPSLEFDKQENKEMIVSLSNEKYCFYDLHFKKMSLEQMLKIDKHMDIVAIRDEIEVR